MTPALHLVAALAAPIAPGTVCTYAAPMPYEHAPELVRVVVVKLQPTMQAEPGAWVQPIGRNWPKAQWHLSLAKLRECEQ